LPGPASGPALHADSLQVDQAMLLTGGFTATGTGEEGAARLTSARIGGELNCDGATLRNHSGPGLRASRLQVDGDMYSPAAAIGRRLPCTYRSFGSREFGRLARWGGWCSLRGPA
jgi:hypothetical protein